MPRLHRLLTGACAAVILAALAGCGTQEPESPSGGDRIVKHAKGQTTISGTPQRVVVLDTGELDAALALGVRPVGTTMPDASNTLQPYLAQKAGKIEVVGTIGEPNLEKIAALKPDLILSSKVRDDAHYGALSAIAPTVFAESVGKTWKQNFLLDAEALGKKAEAQRILGEYRNRASETGKRLGDPGTVRVSMVRFTPADIRLYGTGSFIGTILADVGLNRPPNQQTGKTFTRLSRELIAQSDSDRVFYSAYGNGGKQQQAEVVGSAQWRNLSAVRAGKAAEVADDTWLLGLGPLAANLVLEDLRKAFG
ncbi:ABC transporter substrate-binding protein [Sciscionella sediminilitoris]|uniref:ABC transporter substrate-binding protein n=1 Tax=Sciscionella sediminilitoris TaxID=1445613 RepID=UPI0004DF87EC|nr:iron-siderophore ABC transporter substrate-binding protein [Sciscionella sp. SE31]